MRLHGRTYSLKLGNTRWKVRLLPQPAPKYWVPIFPPADIPFTGRRLRTWPYVLQALRIPYRLRKNWQNNVLYVPALYANKAAVNLWEFDDEEAHPQLAHRLPDDRAHAWLATLLVIPLIILYALQNWELFRPAAAFLGFPEGDNWPDLLGCDNIRMRLFGEWTRAVTALFVHADISHLVANVVFSCLFLRLLACRTGAGLAVFLTIWSGGLANAACALLRHGFILSIGFSTALFAAVGALAGFTALFSRPKAMLPLAAGFAILALLGTEGENTDYMAHVAGLCTGMVTGFLSAVMSTRLPVLHSLLCQIVLGILSVALLFFCFALRLG